MKNFLAPERRLRGAASVLIPAICLLWVFAVSVFPAHAHEKRVYQTDQYGNVQYHKPGFKVVAPR